MRRLTILLAAVGALMLLPAAQAFANGTAHIEIGGEGSGEVSSVGGYSGFYESAPPIKCSYKAPGPATGTCDTELVEEEEVEPGLEGIGVHAVPAPGSVFAGWIVSEGFSFELGGQACGPYKPGESNFSKCVAGVETGGGNAEVIAIFECQEEKVGGGCKATFPLTVNKEGTGSGTVVSSPAGIECGSKCSSEYVEGKVVTLTASPSSDSTFVSWKGCDAGGANGRQCTVTMSKAKTVSAKFTKTYTVAVTRKGSGLGKVQSSPGGVLCLANCASTTTAFKEGTSVTLTAVPSKHFTFGGWSGPCSGTGTCALTMSENKSVEAEFVPVPQFTLTMSKAPPGVGGGNGTVKSNLAGINCGATCAAMTSSYYQGEEVELTATPGKGSSFGGWTGDCTGTGTCKVAMSEGKIVTAIFK